MNQDFHFLIYNTPDNDVRINAVIKDDTIWLTQKAMGVLFDTSTDNISLHLKNIYNDGELVENATAENFSVVQKMDSAIPLHYTQNDEDDCHSATSLCHSARSRRIQHEGSNGFRNYVRNDGEIR